MNTHQQIMEEERNEYSKALEKQSELKAVILGQDPYPENPMGIAFCKHTFPELFDKSCSGQHLLFSLGLTEKSISEHKELFKYPKDVFYYLLANGIAILNISHKILDAPFIENQTSKEFNTKLFLNNKEKILEAKKYNQPFLKKSEMIFILGKWKTKPIFFEYYKEFQATETLLHPSYFNTKEKEEWEKIWGSKYLINKIKQGGHN